MDTHGKCRIDAVQTPPAASPHRTALHYDRFQPLISNKALLTCLTLRSYKAFDTTRRDHLNLTFGLGLRILPGSSCLTMTAQEPHT